MCECYQTGGPFIAEDPECPVHGENRPRFRHEDFDRWADAQHFDQQQRNFAEMIWEAAVESVIANL